MLNTEEMSGTNCIAWFKIKTKGMKPDAIGQLIEEMREGTGLAPRQIRSGKEMIKTGSCTAFTTASATNRPT